MSMRASRLSSIETRIFAKGRRISGYPCLGKREGVQRRRRVRIANSTVYLWSRGDSNPDFCLAKPGVGWTIPRHHSPVTGQFTRRLPGGSGLNRGTHRHHFVKRRASCKEVGPAAVEVGPLRHWNSVIARSGRTIVVFPVLSSKISMLPCTVGALAFMNALI